MIDVKRLVDNLLELMERKEYDKARRKLEDAEKEIPREDFSHFENEFILIKGSLSLSLGDLETAQSLFEELLKKNANSTEACLGLSQTLYLMGQKKEAKVMAEWAVKNSNGENITAKIFLSDINKELNLPEEDNSLLNNNGIEDFDKIITDAYKLFSDKKYRESITLLLKAEKAIENEKQSPEHFERRGSVANFKGFNYLGLNQLRNARTAFETALHYNPNSSQACAGLGEVLYLTEMYKEAKVMFEWALENNLGNKFAQSGLSKTNEKLGLHPTHLTLHEALEEVSKDDFYPILGEAYRMFGEREYEESIKLIKKAERILKKGKSGLNETEINGALENFKGFNYLGLGDPEAARKCFEKTLKKNPISSQACAGLGEVFYLEGNLREAKTMFEWGVKNNEFNKFAVENLKKVNRELGLEDDHFNEIKSEN